MEGNVLGPQKEHRQRTMETPAQPSLVDPSPGNEDSDPHLPPLVFPKSWADAVSETQPPRTKTGGRESTGQGNPAGC